VAGSVRVGRVRGSRQTVAVAAFALALLVPALPLAAQEVNVSPRADLVATEQDGRVVFDAAASTDPDGSVVGYEWDLDGDGVYEKTGTDPAAEGSYPAGTALIASVRVTDDRGATDDAVATVAVPEPAPARASEPKAGAAAATAPEPEPEPDAQPAATKKADPVVRAAASSGVTIKDFSFAPATVSIGVGDTVTWTNQGPSIHTATANDGSFDSGNLDKGESFSKTFNSAGTFSYICTPHPFMTGKIVVASSSGAGGSGGGGGGGGTGAGTGTGTGTGTSAGTLARTGVDLRAWAAFGAALFMFGAALRWRLNVE
jgi:plastocyanin